MSFKAEDFVNAQVVHSRVSEAWWLALVVIGPDEWLLELVCAYVLDRRLFLIVVFYRFLPPGIHCAYFRHAVDKREYHTLVRSLAVVAKALVDLALGGS